MEAADGTESGLRVETTLVDLQDITLDKILNEGGRKGYVYILDGGVEQVGQNRMRRRWLATAWPYVHQLDQ
ncbi:Homeobox-leucine zipper protein HOX9 [Acorus calamus]|uniref:Homeobox-leucine zipper protein HOX9 n=1 Tax=Acorus calamus TaxID=4465 RepID=A0AAV9FKC2_ACOCL|nr:Homeobox-leucine zipper protein HOX9 [Acorus calamus]